MATPTPKPKYFQDGDSHAETGFSQSVMETLYQAYRPFFRKIVFIFVVGFIGRVILLANTNIIGVWVDTFCNPASSGHCRPVPAVFADFSSMSFLKLLGGMVLLGFLMTVVFRVVFSRMSAQAISQLYDEVTIRTSRFPMSFFDKTPAGRIITRFSSDYGNVFRLFGGPLAEFISIVFDLTVMTILITVASPYYLIFVGILAGFNYLVYRLNQKSLRSARRELSASRSPSIAHFAETTQGASTIRSFQRQESFMDRFQRLDSYFLNQKLKTTKRIVSFSFQMIALSACMLLAMGISAYYLLHAGKVSVGSIGVAFTFVALSGNTIQMFFEWLTQLEEALIGVERLDHYLRKGLEPGNLLPAKAKFATGHPTYSPGQEETLSNQRLCSGKNASVQVKNLWFKYRDDLPWVLKDIHFEVKAGERLGIIGRTGSGKSSLIQALFYLYPLHEGTISIDNKSPDISGAAGGVDLNLYRRAIAFISQDPILFQGSLKYNLDVQGQFEDAHLLTILDQVGLKEWVLNQPAGLELKIEERGKNLSLGERQLLCMARCLLQDAPIVIMDEATSSVDPQSEEIMVRATEEFFSNRTQIIIAHRLSTLAKCDRILWLHDGRVQAIGAARDVLPKFESASLSTH